MGASIVSIPKLDEDHRDALVRAAKLAGNPTLVSELERLALDHMRERSAGPAPQMRTVYKDLRDLARHTDRLRRKLEFARWERRFMGELAEPPLPSYYGLDLDFLLANTARRARLAASRIDPDDGRPADRQPVTPLWRLVLALAEAWADNGGRVGIGSNARFFAFASAVVSATGGTLPERVANDVARCWRRRAASVTTEAKESASLSF
jgi:hypothetical protein